MDIEWFGWLTKGQYEVSMLDWLIMFGELVVVLAVVCVPLGILEARKDAKEEAMGMSRHARRRKRWFGK